MRIARVGPATDAAPAWPPLLATRGPGARSKRHAHHGIHIVFALQGALRWQADGDSRSVAGIVTAPDAPHAIDGRGATVALVFLDPESDAGAALRAAIEGPARPITAKERDALARDFDPMGVMREQGLAWTRRAVEILGGTVTARPPRMHPRVRRLLRELRVSPRDDVSLAALAEHAGLSPGRFMHVFTQSVGVPLRPYLAWLKLQRAAAAIAGGATLSAAAATAGFADAAHMTRTFNRMFGIAPSELRAQIAAS